MRKVVFLFPGQSSQKQGMLRELYQESSTVRQTFEEASMLTNYDFRRICFEDQQEMLRDISISAPILLTASLATFRHFMENYQATPSFMAGHSLGEYSALTCAGVFSFETALSIVIFRAKLAQSVMEEKKGVMTVIYNTPYQEIEELCRTMRRNGRKVWVSCNNSSVQCCASGTEEDIALLEKKAAKRGASYRRIVGNAPFHSPMMDNAAEPLAEFIGQCKQHPPQYPVISNWSQKPYHQSSVTGNLFHQLVHPVKWFQSMDYIKRQHTDIWIELGSGQVLSKLMKTDDYKVHSYELSGDRKLIETAFHEGR
ncbi:[acyl-carrier-protein] S-malonyltransferase [Paenibacillus cellulosilyticus]|uniref:Malonyl CoA-acyl carrier protein transacylase n=1 Tax=Paenibacillus cellulosilyticus TaxID=375489 RepID=A0A2V2YXN3_9BACL|nr:ACP S-malonyltransferase [Paenibacillus cellulosilyticus]PWW06588.1 [acyl-carrier-protein] S-malonyltransferase [Paenibacillus cellulosilyticus]QKS46083.1 ACP S-malonyltransferase [Paenibacillus cellulosilyticus]